METFNPWQQLEGEADREILRFHKRFPAEPDVIISIFKTAGNYEVRTSAEARTSEQCNTVDGNFPILGEAIKFAELQCKNWDDDIENFDLDFNLKILKLITPP